MARLDHVLVIGGAGYIGTVLADALLAQGYQVRVLDNFLYGHVLSAQSIIGRPHASLLVGDFRDRQVLELALDGITDVVLLASLVGDPISRKYPDLTWAVNVAGGIALLDNLSGRGLNRVVFTSTCSNYGLRATEEPATEDSELQPLSPYAETKVALERFILERRRSFDFNPVILRLATAFGLSPRMRFDLTVNEFTYIAAKGAKLSVYDKETWRPYCHVRDIAAAVIACLQQPESMVEGEVFNVGSDENNFTKQGIVEEILRYIDANVSFVDGGSDVRNYRVSFGKIQDRLSFHCQYSVQSFVPELIEAVRDGLFAHVVTLRDYYGNYRVGRDIVGADVTTSSPITGSAGAATSPA
jgi:nucleoside-diphosphate-sugar epimerase